MEKVLITGGAGFIGSHTADLLLSQNIPVRVLDNLSSGHRHNLPEVHSLFEFIEGDITDAPTVNKAMEGVSHCLNLAAQVSVVASLEDPQFSAMQNIIGFVNVLVAAQKNQIEKLVYASSAAIYGEPSEIPLPETAIKQQLSPYGLEKQVNEEYADMFSRIYDLPSLGQRFFNVYGPRQDPTSPYAGVIALFVERISRSADLTVFGDGSQTRDFIYVGDVARANMAALENKITGACNIATGQQTSLLDLINVLSEITGRSCQVTHVSPREGDIKHSLANPARMNQKLGFVAETDIRQGLTKLIESVS
ncbi:MAG: NAD-dependent epimerase/dehydratase family protein [Gammaproteobacteria bacterium]|nr:NAD-dependent epimerase/dehydratase family protein [Gammaproteobacteria bacterium]